MRLPFDAQLIGEEVLGSSSSWGMDVLVSNWYGDLPDNGEPVLTKKEKETALPNLIGRLN